MSRPMEISFYQIKESRVFESIEFQKVHSNVEDDLIVKNIVLQIKDGDQNNHFYEIDQQYCALSIIEE